MRATLRINPPSRLARLREVPAYLPPVLNQVYGRVSPGLRLQPVGAARGRAVPEPGTA
jgi:hypothetical protein